MCTQAKDLEPGDRVVLRGVAWRVWGRDQDGRIEMTNALDHLWCPLPEEVDQLLREARSPETGQERKHA